LRNTPRASIASAGDPFDMDMGGGRSGRLALGPSTVEDIALDSQRLKCLISHTERSDFLIGWSAARGLGRGAFRLEIRKAIS